MQLMLFLALLYYLLAAQSDPLLAAVGVLPLSEAGRQRTAVALNRALGGARGRGGWVCMFQNGVPGKQCHRLAFASNGLLFGCWDSCCPCSVQFSCPRPC